MSDARISDGQKNLQRGSIYELRLSKDCILELENLERWLLRCVKSGLVSGLESTGWCENLTVSEMKSEVYCLRADRQSKQE